MLSFCAKCLTLLLLVGALSQPRSARAGDLDDCRSSVLEKAEPACSAIINDAKRAPDDRLTAYAQRSRVYAFRGKADLAMGCRIGDEAQSRIRRGAARPGLRA